MFHKKQIKIQNFKIKILPSNYFYIFHFPMHVDCIFFKPVAFVQAYYLRTPEKRKIELYNHDNLNYNIYFVNYC